MTAETSLHFGQFELADGRKVYGKLALLGRASYLEVHDANRLDVALGHQDFIAGTLLDGSKVTAVGCIPLSANNTYGNGGVFQSSLRVFPHYVLTGKENVRPSDAAITQYTFQIDDAGILFHDPGAFGVTMGSPDALTTLTTGFEPVRPTAKSGTPIIAYFTGGSVISDVKTNVGRVLATHGPRFDMGGPDGAHIHNTISIAVVPSAPVTLANAIDGIEQLSQLYALLLGRPQNVTSVSVTATVAEKCEVFHLHWSHSPQRISDALEKDNSRPNWMDLPLQPVLRAAEFGAVMSAWLATNHERRHARWRFQGAFGDQNNYSADRVIAAANMFDLLPDSVYPSSIPLSDAWKNAKVAARKLFKPLPASHDKTSALNAIGRIGKPNLKHKVRTRASVILGALEPLTKEPPGRECFPNLMKVLDEAVNCRNYFVHGSKTKLDYGGRDHRHRIFLTNALEFVFAAAELIEAGWDIKLFVTLPTTMSHPFGRLCVNYKQDSQALLAALLSATSIQGDAAEDGETE